MFCSVKSIGLAALALLVPLDAAEKFDLVVYGGTAGGAMTAVAAAREGLRVALLEPGRHIGGMVSGGLSKTDTGKREVIGGYTLEFYRRVGDYYGMHRYAHRVAWRHEPHVGEDILRAMLDEAGVTIHFGCRLLQPNGVTKSGDRIASIRAENGDRFEARIFADASYEGDLMAQARVSYTYGRESSATYGESLAGVRPTHRYLVFPFPMSGKTDYGELAPEVQAGSPGPIGAGDKKIQAYNFRVCVSSDPANQVAFPKPEHYTPSRFLLLSRLLQQWERKMGRPPRISDVLLIGEVPNNKADINNGGAFSTDYIGMNWEYPDAGYSKRAEIWRDHLDYTKSLFHFLANDESVPRSLREQVNKWGLCKDEFADNGHWPHQLYVREARRMIGEYVMTQKDLQTERGKRDAIGMGSYNSDSHTVQRYLQPDGTVQNEGLMEVPVQPYQIPYRMMVPKRGECSNLLVPVAFSASHVAYSSLRMEPQYMIIGHAAGVAARLAIESNVAVQEVNTDKLGEILRSQGTVFTYNPAASPPTRKSKE